MFYLLKSNQIIDSKDEKTFKQYISLKEQLSKFNNTGSFINIKKQSENLLELIEAGDLIKIDSDLTREQLTLGSGVYEVLSAKRLPSGEWKIKTNADGDDINGDWYEFFPETLVAIYKLDVKGNYIKVWETK